MSSTCAQHTEVPSVMTCTRCGSFACEACRRDPWCQPCTDRRVSRPRAPMVSLAIAGGLVALPLFGELNARIALLQMGVMCVALPLALWSLLRALKDRRTLGTMGLCVVSVVLSARLTMGVPLYVKRNAAPLISAVEQWRTEHGDWPPRLGFADPGAPEELDKLFAHSGCYSTTRGNGAFGITCMGVLFTKCSWRAETDEWFSWD